MIGCIKPNDEKKAKLFVRRKALHQLRSGGACGNLHACIVRAVVSLCVCVCVFDYVCINVRMCLCFLICVVYFLQNNIFP